MLEYFRNNRAYSCSPVIIISHSFRSTVSNFWYWHVKPAASLQMRTVAAADVAHAVTAVCVSLYVIHNHELCQNGRTNRDAAVWNVSSGGPCDSRGPTYTPEKRRLGEIFRPVVKQMKYPA